jgi:hypothetical protein
MEFPMINYKELELSVSEPGARQEFVWKSALILLCLGIFGLVLWFGGHEPSHRCTDTDPAARETCMRNLGAQATQTPAKGSFPLAPRAAERRAD